MTMNRMAMSMVGIVVGMGVALGGAGIASADDMSTHRYDIEEDSPEWECSTMGNRICGPGNETGLVAGCYNDSGEIVAVWPCYIVVNPDGSSDVYTR